MTAIELSADTDEICIQISM